MTPIDGTIIAGTVYGIVHGSVKWVIPAIRLLFQPAPANGNGYKAAIELQNRAMSRLEQDVGRTREAIGSVGVSVGEVREKIAGLEPRVEVAIDEIGRLRDQVGMVPGEFRDEIDRRFGTVERRLDNNERRLDAAERRHGPDDRRA